MSSLKLFMFCSLLATSSLAAFALAMQRFRWELKRLGRSTRYPVKTLRILAWSQLVACLAIAVFKQGWGIGPVLFFGCFSMAAFIALIIANYRPQWLSGFILLGIVAAIGMGFSVA